MYNSLDRYLILYYGNMNNDYKTRTIIFKYCCQRVTVFSKYR